ncbi:MAG: hypothetical protein WD512_18445 [Candidatus Paceibacterota bacterium]
MKKSFFLSIVMTFALLCTVNVKASEAELLDIAETLKFVESNNNPDAIGDGGKAFGILQIHEASILDVNKHYGTNYVHEDAFNPVIAEDIFVKYLSLGIKLYKDRCGVAPTTNQIVRMWNGGIYKGFEYESTKPYLNKFLKYQGIKLIQPTNEILVSDMPKFLTKSEAVSKFKLEWLPSLKESFGKDNEAEFKEAWVAYKKGLYETAQINTGGLSWKYPNDIV